MVKRILVNPDGRRVQVSGTAAWPDPKFSVSTVGDWFKWLADTHAVSMPEGCSCEALRQYMNSMTAEQCAGKRKELVEAASLNYKKVHKLELFKASLIGMRTGLSFKVDLFDVVGSLFDEAVRLATVKPEGPKKHDSVKNHA